jgi:succinate-semialdehyde dehydrogenase/glutarate-semialdehyde dehydrogenase
VRKEGGEQAVTELLERAGSTRTPEFLDDVSNWISYAEAMSLFDAAEDLVGDMQVARHTGEQTLAQHAGTPVATLLRSLGSPEAVLDKIAVTAARFSTVAEMDAVDKVEELVEDARGKGATVVVGGNALDGRGYFYEPTVLGDVSPDARVLSEEIFGPVAPVTSFESEEDAIKAANNTEFGLVAYVFTSNFKRAIRVIEGLETGMVGLNQGMVSNAAAPFGGQKASGIGREGGFEGIEEYLETKYVAINMD